MKSIHDPHYRQLIKQLTELREVGGFTQADLAKLLGKAQSYVAKVENFDRRLDIIELATWLRALNASPHTFMAAFDWWKN